MNSQAEPQPEDVEVVEETQSADPEDPSAPTEVITIYEESGDLIALAETMKERAEAFRTIMSHALNVTFPTDWVVHQDKGSEGDTAFLQGSGARRLRAFLGIGVTDLEMVREDRKDSDGAFYTYTGRAKFSWMGRVLEATGGASCRHTRLSRGGSIAPQDVDERNVRTFAQTSLTRIGVTNILGLNDYPVSELPELTSSGQPFRKNVRRAEYGTGTKGGDISSADDRKLQDDLRTWATQMFQSGEQAMDWLEHLTEFVNKEGKKVRGLREITRVQGQRLRIAHEKGKEEYINWSQGSTP